MTPEMKRCVDRWERESVDTVAADIAHAMVYLSAKIAGPPTEAYIQQMALAWNSQKARRGELKA